MLSSYLSLSPVILISFIFILIPLFPATLTIFLILATIPILVLIPIYVSVSVVFIARILAAIVAVTSIAFVLIRFILITAIYTVFAFVIYIPFRRLPVWVSRIEVLARALVGRVIYEWFI